MNEVCVCVCMYRGIRGTRDADEDELDGDRDKGRRGTTTSKEARGRAPGRMGKRVRE